MKKDLFRGCEKKPISDVAMLELLLEARLRLRKVSEQMIENNIRFNNEFYVCPVFNEALQDGKKIKAFHFDGMWGMEHPKI